ncbi:MAG: archaellin/type IV pilin N-terminal domain-containing protein [Candidatus Bathyarchaeia archaeon]
MRLRSSRKGVSEIIAALLVVCITVSAGTLLAAYASGVMGRIQTTVTQPYTEQLTLEYYNWPIKNATSPPILTIRNDGAAPITFADFFMNGMSTTVSGCSSLQVQSTCTITFPIPSGLTVTLGIAYMVKFVAKDGTLFTFSIIAGSNTH